MGSREDILRTLRCAPIPDAPAPSLDADWTEYQDPIQHFQAVLESVGGVMRRVATVEQINDWLLQQPTYGQAEVICSCVPGVGNGNLELDAVANPHELETVDFAVLPGHFFVAENAAVWITDQGLRHRVVYFLSQHVALVVPAGEFVHNMHQAYARLSLEGVRFGCFISGPSKTADIEQSLVIGAHGARTLTVFLLDS